MEMYINNLLTAVIFLVIDNSCFCCYSDIVKKITDIRITVRMPVWKEEEHLWNENFHICQALLQSET